jgi:hypothetical protein
MIKLNKLERSETEEENFKFFFKVNKLIFGQKNELSGQNKIFSPQNLGKGMTKHVVLSLL